MEDANGQEVETYNGDPIEETNESQVDPIVNVKSEFNRKLDNVQKQMVEQNEAMMQVLNQLMNQPRPQQSTESEDDSYDDLIYDNPKAYKERLKKEVSQEISSELSQREQQRVASQKAVHETLSTMRARFPEYNDPNSELSRKAIEIYDRMPDSQKSNEAIAYKIAMSEAAIDLGVLPADKRRKVQSDDDFVISGGGGQQMSSNRRSGDKKTKISEKTRALSQLLGQNPDDPKTKERLEKAANRKTWTRYRSPGGSNE